jgi:quercetin dioxygenase-like cupin family protein
VSPAGLSSWHVCNIEVDDENGAMMFYKRTSSGYRQAVKGVSMKTLVYGERTLLTEFRLEAGNTLPGHSHEQEQTGYLVSGRIQLTIGDEIHDVGPGDSWSISANVKHGARILEDSIAIEVFSPVRKDYLPGSGV